MHFLGVAVALVLMVAMLFMWVVLFVREALIYLVVIYAVSFGLPAMIFPPLRDTSKKVLELLVALMIAKPVMVLALSVGVSALGGIGSTGQPGDPVGDNLARELGTLVSGAITFGLAAFMPFLVWRLMPIVAAAVVAQGIASAPLRGSAQAMQVQYYGQSAMRRLSGTATSGATGSSGGRMAGALSGSSSAGGSLPGAAVIGGGATSGGVAAAPVAGAVAPVLAAASVAQAAGSMTKSVADSTISASPTGTQASDSRRKLGGDAT
jgi:hypothetical protein